MNKHRITIALLFLIMIATKMSAQFIVEGKPSPVNLALELKNSHIWRGQNVSTSALIDADLRLTDNSKMFAFGIWGATTFEKDFKEFDYYAGFYKGGFSFEVWDIYNFSDKNAFDPATNTGYNVDEAFDYKARSTGHFVDARLAYTLPMDRFPITLRWNTVVFGRDRARISYLDPTNPTQYLQKYSKSRYSTYVEVEFPVLKSDAVDVKVAVGGAFALKGSKIDGEKIKGNFYGESAGVVNANLILSKRVKITDKYTLPIKATAVWNPEASKTYLEVACQVLQF